MTMLMTDQNTAYSGESAPSTSIGEVVQYNFSGETRGSVFRVFARSDTAAFKTVFKTRKPGIYRLNFNTGTEYYAQVDDVVSDASVDLSVI